MKNITVNISSHSLHKDITVVTVKGFIDTNTAPEFDKSFQSAMAQNKFKLIIDLKDVTYVSSAGWGLFVGEIKRIRSQKGDLFIVGMSPEVEEAYDLLQFNTILKAFPTVEQAVQKGFKRATAAKGPAAPVEKDLELKLAGKRVQVSSGANGDAQPPAAKNLSKPRWYARIFNPTRWF